LPIAEKKAKVAKINELSEAVGSVRNGSEKLKDVSESDENGFKELKRKNLNLKITNRGRFLLLREVWFFMIWACLQRPL
jgi:hypothetical protein